MASSDPPNFEALSFMEQLINTRNRDLSYFLPFILGFSPSYTPRSDETDPIDSNRQESEQIRDRIILINPATQGMIVIEGSRSLEALFREMASKEGLPPASKASIEAMPKVVISEENGGGECSICLEEWEIGGEVRVMPCKHRFHGGCIEKWLGIHGSCPVCRYTMPVDEDGGKKSEDEERGGRRGEIWVSFAFGGRRNSGSGSGSDSDTERGDDDHGGN